MHFPHWQFFESVDEELHSLSRTIEFCRENFPVFSVDLSRLYLSLGSEIDVVAKLLCARVAPSGTPKNIDDYRAILTQRFPKFPEMRTEMPSHGLEFQPWLQWKTGTNPKWWRNYNDVKHERNKYYQEANLGNVLESSAGLLLLLVYHHQPDLYAKNSAICPDFKTMRIERQYAHILRWGCDYSLPDFEKNNDAK
ncbi:MAG TPA: hypothetical protein VFC44_13245 [Candidatus Saccharimonadales bacterium]|jgi:hypothetical protein|nr:hypothetical protein [Candidatus Saccharimonadales bacterium]